MKRLAFLILILTGLMPSLFAQKEDDGKHEKMTKEFMEFKMNYLAKEMDLTDAQKQKFFPLYEEYTHQRRDCSKRVRDIEKKLKKEGKNASEAEYQNLLELQAKTKAELAEIDKVYDEKFAEFLSPKQLYKLKEGETAFRKKLDEMKRNKDHKKK
ncbi:MAG: hypothetical protein J1E82_01390 [Muribaculaceae bacterium]|nr:hypothetical protein [Muribaculaceae bacterium]